MTDLIETGPPAVALRWGAEEAGGDGRTERAFYPEAAFQEPEGFLHGGVAAAAVLGAARLAGADREAATSVAVSLRRPILLGADLQLSWKGSGSGSLDVTFEQLPSPDRSAVPVEALAHGIADLRGREEAPDLDDVRQLAAVPIPAPPEHELFGGCYVCGQDNPNGLQLLPGVHVEGRVVVSFVADERYAEEGVVSPLATCALLSCPTLWAVRHQLEDLGCRAALLADYEVRFHADARVPTVIRTVGFEGTPGGRHAEVDTSIADRLLHGVSALVGQDGRIFATASATWVGVDELPRPGEPPPASEEMPLKAGRAERSPDDWGEPSPGRREAPGPRSAPPDERYQGGSGPRRKGSPRP